MDSGARRHRRAVAQTPTPRVAELKSRRCLRELANALAAAQPLQAHLRLPRHARGMLDCMIAAVASRQRVSLLAHDADMDRVARVIDIELDEASLRA